MESWAPGHLRGHYELPLECSVRKRLRAEALAQAYGGHASISQPPFRFIGWLAQLLARREIGRIIASVS